jgi:GTP pyrophosphokinase
MPELLEALGIASEESLYELLGKGNLPLNRVMEYFLTRIITKHPGGSRVSRFVNSITGRNKESLVGIGGTDTLMVRYGRCCNPLPGDEIIGFVTKGRGISVHRKDCPNAEFFSTDTERSIPLSWEGAAQQARKYLVYLDITAVNRTGLLKDVASVFADCNAEILEVNIATDKQIARGTFQVEIANRTELKHILRNLQRVKGVEKVVRTREKTQISEEGANK